MPNQTRDVVIRIATKLDRQTADPFKELASSGKRVTGVVTAIDSAATSFQQRLIRLKESGTTTFGSLATAAQRADAAMEQLSNDHTIFARIEANTRRATTAMEGYASSARKAAIENERVGRGGFIGSFKAGRQAVETGRQVIQSPGLITATIQDVTNLATGLIGDVANVVSMVRNRDAAAFDPQVGFFTQIGARISADLGKLFPGLVGTPEPDLGREHEQRIATAEARAIEEAISSRRLATALKAPLEEEIAKMQTMLASRSVAQRTELEMIGGTRGEVDLFRGEQQDVLSKLLGADQGRQQAEDQAKRLGDVIAAGAKSAGVAEGDLLEATQERNRALEEQRRIEAEIGNWQSSALTSAEEGLRLFGERQNALERSLGAEQKIAEAIRKQNDARIDQMKSFRDFASEQESYFRNIARVEADRFKGLAERYGELSPVERGRTREAITRTRELGIESLSAKQRERARPFLEEEFRERAVGIAESEGLRRLLAGTAADLRRQQAEERAQVFAELKLQLSQEIQAQVTVNEAELARQLAERLGPLFDDIKFVSQQIVEIQKREAQRAANRPGA